MACSSQAGLDRRRDAEHPARSLTIEYFSESEEILSGSVHFDQASRSPLEEMTDAAGETGLWSSYEEQMADALAVEGDEGRG